MMIIKIIKIMIKLRMMINLRIKKIKIMKNNDDKG